MMVKIDPIITTLQYLQNYLSLLTPNENKEMSLFTHTKWNICVFRKNYNVLPHGLLEDAVAIPEMQS